MRNPATMIATTAAAPIRAINLLASSKKKSMRESVERKFISVSLAEFELEAVGVVGLGDPVEVNDAETLICPLAGIVAMVEPEESKICTEMTFEPLVNPLPEFTVKGKDDCMKFFVLPPTATSTDASEGRF